MPRFRSAASIERCDTNCQLRQSLPPALPGSHRERLILLALVPAPEADPLTTFARSADAVLDSRDATDRTERLRAAFDRAATLPSLFTEGRG